MIIKICSNYPDAHVCFHVISICMCVCLSPSISMSLSLSIYIYLYMRPAFPVPPACRNGGLGALRGYGLGLGVDSA